MPEVWKSEAGTDARKAEIKRRLLLLREPWREYFPYRPDDLPGRNGSPAALAKLAADPELGHEHAADLNDVLGEAA